MPLPPSLKKRAESVAQESSPPAEPVWKGPVKEGITFSMINRFLTCRERFRIAVIEGLKTEDAFNHKIEYGHMWHECERALSAHKDWKPALEEYHKKVQERYRHLNCVDQIRHWYEVCKIQFPIYLRHWETHPDNDKRLPVCQEFSFNIPYDIGGGRVVKLRGKFDAVDVVGSSPKVRRIYLQENKTKGDIEEETIKRQLVFDCQSMLYLTALHTLQRMPMEKHGMGGDFDTYPIGGVRYNVIRRPLSSGRGNIKQHKPTKKNPLGESKQQYYDRLRGIIDGTGDEDAPGPGYFFMRWRAEVTEADVRAFEEQFLRPILHQIVEWYGWVTECRRLGQSPFQNSRVHWRHPFGVTNMINEGFSHDLDEYLRTGSAIGLRRVDRLFEELD